MLAKYLTNRSRLLISTIISFTLAFLGTLIAWNVLSLKLYDILESLSLFGIIYSTIPAFTAVLVRPLIGKFVDVFGARNAYTLTMILYLLYFVTLFMASSQLFIVLWFIPPFPLLDTAIYTLSASMFPPRMQSSASGLAITSQGIAGIILVLINRFPLDYNVVLAIVVTSFITATIISISIKMRVVSDWVRA